MERRGTEARVSGLIDNNGEKRREALAQKMQQ